MFQTEVPHDLNYIFADLSRVLCGEWTVRRQGQQHRGQLGATAIFHARDGGVLDQGDGSEGGEKWLHSGYILKIELGFKWKVRSLVLNASSLRCLS